MGIKIAGIVGGIVVVALGAFFFMGTEKPSTQEEIGTIKSSTNDQYSMEATSTENKHVVFKTNKGDIELELFTAQMPITTGNFLKLAGEGFYNGTKFHRVIEDFMIQGGDPNSKGDDASDYGTGGPGYTIEDEFVAGLSNVRGTIAMANTGRPNSGGSQFFINLIDNVGLDFDKPPAGSSHPVFGKVVSGMEVVDSIAETPTDGRDVPTIPIVISEIVVK